jgi:hypothetical protein
MRDTAGETGQVLFSFVIIQIAQRCEPKKGQNSDFRRFLLENEPCLSDISLIYQGTNTFTVSGAVSRDGRVRCRGRGVRAGEREAGDVMSLGGPVLLLASGQAKGKTWPHPL